MIDPSKELNVIKGGDTETYFIRTNIEIPTDNSISIIRDCIKQHDRRIEKVEPRKYFPTIKIDQFDNFPIYDKLFSTFVEIASKHLKFEIHPRSGRNVWLYFNNKDFQTNYGIHNHIQKSIVGVFYLCVPEIEDEKEGSISFYDSEEKELFNIKPKTNDMIIFPGFLNHSVFSYNGEEPRLSLVMELECY